VSAASGDAAIFEHLERQASRNPRWYRFKLAAIALAGDLALTITQVLPLALPIAIGVLVFNVKLFYWLGAAAVLLFAWMLRPALRITERELARGEAPLLFAELDRLRSKLQVPGRMRVFLDSSLNAGAAETRGWFGILGTQRALMLGVPLLAALDREQALAVVGHELGHFSRRHGRLGHWLYRARVGWSQYAHSVGESDSALDRAAAWYARKFVPFFSAHSFVYSRQCEYEADADAAIAAGSQAFAAALTRMALLVRVWSERLPQQIAEWQQQSPEPPGDFHSRFVRAASNLPPQQARGWLDDALRQPSGWSDTHPSLSARLAALNEEPRLVEPAIGAGMALFGERWHALLQEFDRKWAAGMQPGWLLQHLRLKHGLRPHTLAQLRERRSACPDDKRLQFAYAAALLDDGDEAGAALMESLARAAPAFRVQAFARALAYYERKGDARQVARWSDWLRQAASDLGRTATAAVAEMESGRGRPSSVSGAERAVLADAAHLDPCVHGAWLLEAGAQLRFAADRPQVPVVVHLLALAIDPEEMKRRAQDEEEICQRYESLVRDMLPADEVTVVRTYFTTEMLPAGCSEALRL
jgi:Zn-dependent protease with chaperone function